MYSLYEQMYRTQWNAFIRNLIVFDTPIWVNHPVATYRAENKTFQLKLAKKHGLLIPETHVGNSLREIKDLCDDGLYVIKSLDTALFYDGKHELFTYSNVIMLFRISLSIFARICKKKNYAYCTNVVNPVHRYSEQNAQIFLMQISSQCTESAQIF